MFNRIIITSAVILLTGSAVFASDIMVMEPRAAASITPMAKTGAIYMTLMNHGSEVDVLTKILSPAAEIAQTHETTMTDGIMKMREIERLQLRPNETLVLAPGGTHVMLTGLKAPLKTGETVSLVLIFEKAGEVSVDVPVVSRDQLPAAVSHQHMDP